MAEELASGALKAGLGLVLGDVGASVDLLVKMANSARNCSGMSKALAEQALKTHQSLMKILEESTVHEWKDEELMRSLKKFLVVVNDCRAAVRRYNSNIFVVRMFHSCVALDEFEQLENRLDKCRKEFNLDLVVHIATTSHQVLDAVDSNNLQALEFMKQEMQVIRKLVESNQAGDSTIIPCEKLQLGDTMFEGYMKSAILETEQVQGRVEVVLVQSEETKKEAGILEKLSNHETVLKFYGSFFDEEQQPYLVFEKPMGMTTLDDVIREDVNDFHTNWRLKRQVALDVAECIGYAHMTGILHKNIRSPNIFVACDGSAKVKVFGFFQGRIKSQISAKKWMPIEQVRWAAPEQLSRTRPQFNEECDIFSLGVVMWELIVNDYPFSDFDSKTKLLAARKQGTSLVFHNLDLQPAFLRDFARIALECMNSDPSSRPRMEGIVLRLSKLEPEEMENVTSGQ